VYNQPYEPVIIAAMPAVKQKELVDQLSLAGVEERHQSLCFLINSVIGNKQKKDQYANLGVVSK
jgi:hypothetical protein